MIDTSENNYSNPLDNFRSYSYNFILSLAGTTETLRKLLDPVNGSNRVLASLDNVGLGEEIKLDDTTLSTDKAFLLLDTRRFSQYSITNLECSYAYGTGNKINPSMPMSVMSIKLIDTTGLSFFNFISDALRNKLKTTRASAFYLLTIIFNGHTDDGKTETISMTNIPLILLTMAFEFTSSGSVFDMAFIETEAGVNRGLSMVNSDNLGDIKGIDTKNGSNTVGQMIKNLENQLNIQSLRFYQKYQNEKIADAIANNAVDISTGKLNSKVGKLVQYMITLPNKDPFNWADNFKVDLASASKVKEQKFVIKKTATVDSRTAQFNKNAALAEKMKIQRDAMIDHGNYLNSEDKKKISAVDNAENVADNVYYSIGFSNNTTITDAIKSILESSPQFLDLMGDDAIKRGDGYSYKTVVNITADDDTYLIHIDIYPVKLPQPKKYITADIAKTVAGQTVNDNAIIQDNINNNRYRNLIQYDYLYTGLNTSIRDLRIMYAPESAVFLNMDMDIGANRFADNASNGNTQQAVQNSSLGVNKTYDFEQLIRPGDPIFLPLKTTDDQKNNNSQNTEQGTKQNSIAMYRKKKEYIKNLAFLNYVSSINLQLEIRGNPKLLRKYADRDERGGIAPHGKIVDSTTLESLYGKGQDTAESNFTSLIAKSLTSAKQQYYEKYFNPRLDKITNKTQPNPSDLLLGNADIATSPVFIKLNILAPNVDFNGNQLTGQNGEKAPLFTNQFFYKGPYMVLTIDHKFAGDSFVQVMNLIPYDITGEFSTSGDDIGAGR